MEQSKFAGIKISYEDVINLIDKIFPKNNRIDENVKYCLEFLKGNHEYKISDTNDHGFYSVICEKIIKEFASIPVSISFLNEKGYNNYIKISEKILEYNTFSYGVTAFGIAFHIFKDVNNLRDMTKDDVLDLIRNNKHYNNLLDEAEELYNDYLINNFTDNNSEVCKKIEKLLKVL